VWGYSHVIYSDDQGETWQLGGMMSTNAKSWSWRTAPYEKISLARFNLSWLTG
jgi:hypothetical protein